MKINKSLKVEERVIKVNGSKLPNLDLQQMCPAAGRCHVAVWFRLSKLLPANRNIAFLIAKGKSLLLSTHEISEIHSDEGYLG